MLKHCLPSIILVVDMLKAYSTYDSAMRYAYGITGVSNLTIGYIFFSYSIRKKMLCTKILI